MSPEHALVPQDKIIKDLSPLLLLRFAFVQLHIFSQQQVDRVNNLAHSAWEAIGRHLGELQTKSREYKRAYVVDLIDRDLCNTNDTTVADFASSCLILMPLYLMASRGWSIYQPLK